MSLTGWADGNYLRRLAGIIGVSSANTNVLISAWGWRVTAVNAPAIYLGIQGQANNGNSRSVWANAAGIGGGVFAGKAGAGGTSDATTATGFTDEVWGHLAGALVGNDLAEAWVDGGGKATDNTTATGDSTISDYTVIGRTQTTSSSPAWPSDGALAEISLWDVTGFSEANRNALAALLATASPTAPNPLVVDADSGQPWEGALLAYWRLSNTTDLSDLSENGHDLSLVGSLSTFGSNPPVDPVPTTDMALGATTVSAARINLAWTNPPGTDAVRVLRRGPPTAVVFSDNYTGPNGTLWSASGKWVQENIGTATTVLDTNRGEMTVADVGSDDVRVRALDDEGQPLVLDKVRAEFSLEPQHATGLTSSVGYGFGINLRHVGGVWATVAHDPQNGYRLIVYRGDTSDDLSVAIGRAIDGVFDFPGGNGITIPGATIDAVNVRVEAVGDHIRMLVRDASLGLLPNDEWDIDITDSTHPSGQVSISVRGPTGGGSPDRVGFIDGLVIFGANYELVNVLGAVESYPDFPPYGLSPSTLYDYQAFAEDAGVDIGDGEASATTSAAPSGGGGGPLLASSRIIS